MFAIIDYNIFFVLIFNSLVIVGLFEAMYYSTEKGGWNIDDNCEVSHSVKIKDKMLLWFIPYTLRKWGISEYLLKCIATCPTCMASFHSTYVYWFFFNLTTTNALFYILYIPALAGLNAIIVSLYDKD